MTDFIKHRRREPHERTSLLLVVILHLAGMASIWAADAPAVLTQLKGKLVTLSGPITVPVKESAVGDPKYFALYFGAGWCGPCHQFTPELVSFYKEMKPQHPEFEIVFISHDNSAPEMQQYMAEMHMPWPAIRFDAIQWSTQLNQLCGPGIPCLVLIDGRGQVLSDSYQGQNYLGPRKVLVDLRKLLQKGESAPASTMAAPSPSPVQGGSPNTPSGTEWDKFFKKKTP